MDTNERTARLLEAFQQLHDLFTRHRVDLFIHLRRHTQGHVALRFHTPWPAPVAISEELDAMACELNLVFRPEHVEGVGLVVSLEPVHELDELGLPSDILPRS